ncbi:hypothetical protein AIOL_001952 [Candidatus Rhodobacter oscarellae]|uniref:Thioredoxin family protein n=1 Tax=Candidatus Rhodobacter oscarellae TaxID=1675527 RepID=A0A0J9E586_9RHOB|nr:DUF899 family protein [Candidatus Rhodobacter lobularis]KMW56994.1 hypothetical protein AIOL_001952 [Candidatus Rhodobacter lobularis]
MQKIAASKDDWVTARTAFLAKEKAHTRERDALAEARRALPALKVQPGYSFTGPDGRMSLRDLFGDKTQLAVFHFMFGDGWAEGCPSCSFWADNLDGVGVHLAHRDLALVAVSSAPYPDLAAYRARMGWSFPWVSAHGSSFNSDMGVSFTQAEIDAGTAMYNYAPKGFPSTEAPGFTFYRREGDDIYLTYATYGRGLDHFNGAYQLLDLAPKGRGEADLPWPMAWLRRHDQYDAL